MKMFKYEKPEAEKVEFAALQNIAAIEDAGDGDITNGSAGDDLT